MERAIAAWRCAKPGVSGDINTFLRKVQKSYVVYGDMGLLPSTAYVDVNEDGSASGISSEDLRHLYELMVKHLKITHIATALPIPLLDDDEGSENILRAPTNFMPLYGSFGPATCSSPPTQEDFNQAYWATAKQNGIYQTWAPRWTMFSRGNISEKARLLTLLSVVNAVADGEVDDKGCSAVDLYAGIGYFTFSYLKAGVSKVLCFDINSWSIEGLMRGAKANKWKATLVRDSDDVETVYRDPDVRLVVCNENNTLASTRVAKARHVLPPIRHVNCGLLPTSRGSWRTAVEVLDDGVDGWIHVHENFAVSEIESKADEVRRDMQMMVGEVRRGSTALEQSVRIEGINRLKSYAPGVMHCVLDVYIPARVSS